MADFGIGIQAYKKINELNNIRSEDFSDFNNYEISFQNALKAAEDSFNSGIVNQTSVKNSPINKLNNNIIDNVKRTLDKTEDLATKSISQNASTAETVAIAMHAESLIKTVVSIRDKLLSSYQEILRMNI